MEITIFSERIEYALGWALVHSLWQITILGLLLTVVLRLVMNPEHRYRLAYGTLLLSFLVSLLTGSWYFMRFDLIDSVVVHVGVESFFYDPEPFVGNEPFTWVGWLESQQPIIVQIWLIGFTLLTIRLAGGLWFLNRLRSKSSPISFDGLSLEALSVRLGIGKKVEALLSSEIKLPITFGWIKPVILLPAGYINQLTTVEVEAILLHELSHIRRYDWVFNLLQAVVEAVFYFHPMLWWISSTVRMERERCCDELAVARIDGGRMQYVRSLLKVQQLSQETPGSTDPVLAMGMGESRRKGLFRRRAFLLERIQHILLNVPQQQSMIMERMIILGLLVASITAWGLQAAPKVPTTFSAATAAFFSTVDLSFSEFGSDTIPPKAQKSMEDSSLSEDRKIEVEMIDGQITKLKVNDKEIPAAEYYLYPDVINRAGPNGYRLFDEHGNTPMGHPTQIEVGDSKMILIWNGKEIPSDIRMRKMIIEDGKGSVMKFVSDSLQVIRIDATTPVAPSMQWEELTEDIMEENGKKKVVKVIGIKSNGSELDRAQIEQMVMERIGEEDRMGRMEEEDGMEDLFSGAVPTEGFYWFEDDKAAFTRVMLKELRRDFLVTDEHNYSVELSPKRFKVNGKKQPDNMVRKYLKLYEDRMGRPMTSSTSIKLEVKI
jgi:beta-lactamase regulating signal transducer with metallopeptidase domain